MIGVIGNLYFYRYALHDFGELAGGGVARYEHELRARGIPDFNDLALKGAF